MTTRQVLGIGLLWLLVIGGIIISKQITIWTGTTVRLQTQPVDPYDLFRGDYVTLRYRISDMNRIPDFSRKDTPVWTPASSSYAWSSGDTVYVVLRQQPDGTATAEYKTPQYPTGNVLFLKGTVSGYNANQIDYGIESYFVPQGKGKDIERSRGTNLFVSVTIDRWGNAVIRDLVMTTQPAPSIMPL